METADQLIELSAGEFRFSKETMEHDNPLLSRHFYMLSKGKSRTLSNSHSKAIEGESQLNKDGKPGATVMALADGDMTAFQKSGDAQVKIEFPLLNAARPEAEILRSVCAHIHTHTQHAPNVSS